MKGTLVTLPGIQVPNTTHVQVVRQCQLAPQLFICHTGADAVFSDMLHLELLFHGFRTWYSRVLDNGGIPLKDKVKEGLATSDILLVVVSQNALHGDWFDFELNEFRTLHPSGLIIPIRLDETMPGELAPMLAKLEHIDFRRSHVEGYRRLMNSLGINYRLARQHDRRAVERRHFIERRDVSDTPVGIGRRLRRGIQNAYQGTEKEFQTMQIFRYKDPLSLVNPEAENLMLSLLPELKRYQFVHRMQRASVDPSTVLYRTLVANLKIISAEVAKNKRKMDDDIEIAKRLNLFERFESFFLSDEHVYPRSSVRAIFLDQLAIDICQEYEVRLANTLDRRRGQDRRNVFAIGRAR